MCNQYLLCPTLSIPLTHVVRVNVSFSHAVVHTTEKAGQVPVTVVAAGDLSCDFSITVKATSHTAVGKFFSRKHVLD